MSRPFLPTESELRSSMSRERPARPAPSRLRIYPPASSEPRPIEVQRIAMVPVDTLQSATPAFISPANLHVYEFDWSPDSKSFAYIAADPPGENNWWVARLYTQRVEWLSCRDTQSHPRFPVDSTACRSPFLAGRLTENPLHLSVAS